MKRFVRSMAAALVVALPASFVLPEVSAQNEKYAKAGPENRMLVKMFSGTWSANVKMYMPGSATPIESTGIMKRQATLGNRFVRELYNGKFKGKKFQGLGMIGYDRMQKKFVTTWADSMSTGLMVSYGKYDPKTKTFSFVGKGPGPAGKEMTYMSTHKVESPKKHVMEMYASAGGKKFKMLEIVYTLAAGGQP